MNAEYLAEVGRLLWPVGPASASTESGRPGSADMIIIPSARAPRLLVPSGRKAGAAALRTYGEPGSARAALATRSLAALVASGASGLILRDRLSMDTPSIQTYLSDVLGRPVQVSLHLRAARANRKPVLQLLAPDGQVIGVAKIGINPLTTELVRAERATLEALSAARPASFLAPRVLAAGTWNGLEVLVLSALPVWLRRIRPRPGQLAAAATEVASLSVPPPAEDFWRRLNDRFERSLAHAEDGTARADHAALRPALCELPGLAADADLRFAAWHGDWVPWNMAFTRDGLLIWDWERFAAGVPIGFDFLHYWLQRRVATEHHDPAAAAADCVERAPDLLDAMGVRPRQARLTALAYLAELSVRYLADKQAEAGARLGAPGRWLIPALRAGLTRTAAAGAP